MFNRKGEADAESASHSYNEVPPINALFDKVKDKLPAVFFIRLLDAVLLGIESESSKRFRVSFIFNELIKYKKNNRVLFTGTPANSLKKSLIF